MIKLSASVGKGAQNLIHDVTVIQFALKIFGYFNRQVNGNADVFFLRALEAFAMDQADFPSLNNGKVQVKPNGNLLRAINKGFPNDKFPNLRAFKHTKDLYIVKIGSVAQKRLPDDFLITGILSKSLSGILNNLLFNFVFEEVRLQPLNDKFLVKLKFPFVGYVDTRNMKPVWGLPANLINSISNLSKSSDWKISQEHTNSAKSMVALTTRKRTGLYSTVGRLLTDKSGVGRVFQQDSNGDLIIPPKQELLRAAGIIHAERCASTGEAGGIFPISRKTAKLALGILSSSVERYDIQIENHCASCREIGANLKTSYDQITRSYETIRASDQILKQTIDQDSVVQQYRRAEKKLKVELVEALFSSIPGMVLDAKAFVQGRLEFSEESALLEGLTIIGGIILATAASAAAIVAAEFVVAALAFIAALNALVEAFDAVLAAFDKNSLEKRYIQQMQTILREHYQYILDLTIGLEALEVNIARLSKILNAENAGMPFSRIKTGN